VRKLAPIIRRVATGLNKCAIIKELTNLPSVSGTAESLRLLMQINSLVGRVSHWTGTRLTVETINVSYQTVVTSGTDVAVQSTSVVSTVLSILHIQILSTTL